MSALPQPPTTNSVPLSLDEKEKLEKALKRATEFQQGEELDLMRQPLEGQLLKFTNAFQGWQTRWFVLDPKIGVLRYYKEEAKTADAAPRGSMVLAGATVCPSEEDSMAFVVTPVTGDAYKLKASDTKERSEWINRLRVVSEDHGERKIRKHMTTAVKTPIPAEDVREGTANDVKTMDSVHQATTLGLLDTLDDCQSVLHNRLAVLSSQGAGPSSSSSLAAPSATHSSSFRRSLRSNRSKKSFGGGPTPSGRQSSRGTGSVKANGVGTGGTVESEREEEDGKLGWACQPGLELKVEDEGGDGDMDEDGDWSAAGRGDAKAVANSTFFTGTADVANELNLRAIMSAKYEPYNEDDEVRFGF